jgi:hypothetical protein
VLSSIGIIRAILDETATTTTPHLIDVAECTVTWFEAVECDATRCFMTLQCLAEEEARCRLVAGFANV